MSYLFSAGIGAAIGALSARALNPHILRLCREHGYTKPNYSGAEIPYLAGVSVVLGTLAGQAGEILALPWQDIQSVVCAGLVVLGMGFLGLVDDVLGDRSARGLRGHLGALISGRGITTGGLKALFGLLVAGLAGVLLAAFPPSARVHGEGLPWGAPWLSWPLGPDPRGLLWRAVDAFLNTSVIALSANMVNLLDLRPGRAIKGFGFLAAAALGIAALRQDVAGAGIVLAPALGAALAVFAPDLRAIAMLGDVGANAIGGAAGVALAVSAHMPEKAFLTIVLFSLHLLSERVSFSELIERVALLRALDGLGRPREAKTGEQVQGSERSR